MNHLPIGFTCLSCLIHLDRSNKSIVTSPTRLDSDSQLTLPNSIDSISTHNLTNLMDALDLISLIDARTQLVQLASQLNPYNQPSQCDQPKLTYSLDQPTHSINLSYLTSTSEKIIYGIFFQHKKSIDLGTTCAPKNYGEMGRFHEETDGNHESIHCTQKIE